MMKSFVVRFGMLILSLLLIFPLFLPSGVCSAKEVKIGVIYPLTGGAAAAGRELRAGAELAAKIANNVMADLPMTMAKNSGIKSLGGVKIKLIFKDHEGNPTLGADLAKKLKVHPAKVRRLISIFQKGEIVRPYLYMGRVGLHRHTLAIFKADAEYVDMVKWWCMQFPSSEFLHLEDPQTSDKGILALIGLPKDGIYRINRVLYRAGVTDAIKLFVREVEIGLGRVLPPLKIKK